MNYPKEKIKPVLKVPLAEPWFTDEEAKATYDVVNSKWLIFGPETAEFERQFARKMGVKHAIAVNSGSSALLVAQAAVGISKDDEIIVPDMTFVSTASSSMYLGAKPVFADIELSAYCIDTSDIEKRITDRTKAIIPVHYAGQSADMDKITKIAETYDLIVIEDAAEAHLSEYKGRKVGTLGDAAIFSFTPSKPMTTGEGGMITTNNDEIAARARLIKNFGDADKFKWNILGFNFRMPEVMGAIGKVQLKKLDRAVKIRRNIAKEYTESFSNVSPIITPYVRSEKDHNFQLYTIRLELNKLSINRDQFICELADKGISSRLYYPCLHNQEVFNFKEDGKDFPNSKKFSKTALSLPIFPGLSKDQVHYVIEHVSGIVKKYEKV